MDLNRILQICSEIPGQTWPRELAWIYNRLKTSSAHVEIGSYCGRSLLASAFGMKPDGMLVSVDSRLHSAMTPVPKEWVNTVYSATTSMFPKTLNFTFLEMTSLDAAKHCLDLGLQFDSIFIDGGHRYVDVELDIKSWLPLLKDGALICGHDYWPNHIGVMKAVNTIFKNFDTLKDSRIWYTQKGEEF